MTATVVITTALQHATRRLTQVVIRVRELFFNGDATLLVGVASSTGVAAVCAGCGAAGYSRGDGGVGRTGHPTQVGEVGRRLRHGHYEIAEVTEAFKTEREGRRKEKLNKLQKQIYVLFYGGKGRGKEMEERER